MATTYSANPYEYQGQVYSPAFSEPSSPASSTSSAPSSPKLSRRLPASDEFVSKRPKFAHKYEEMLQPLSPVTTLPSSQKLLRPMPRQTHKSRLDVKLQCQFHDLVGLSGHEEVEDFLARHLEKLD